MDGFRLETDTLGQYLDDVHTDTIEIDPDVQRDFCWTKESLNNLIASAVSGKIFIPNLILAEGKAENNVKFTYIVDGGNRTEALRRFRYGGHKTNKEIREPIIKYSRKKLDEQGRVMHDQYGDVVWEIAEFDLRNKTYEDLPKELKRQFNKCQLAVTIYQDCTLEDSAMLVNIYNNHTAMNTSQKALTYIGKYAKEIRRIKKTSEFLKDCTVLTETEKKNGVWERVISECVMGIYHFEDWKKDPKKMCDYLNSNSSIEEYRKIESYFNRIAPFSDKLENRTVANLFTQKDILVWVMAFGKFDKFGIDDKNFGEFLNAFENMRNKEVNGVTWKELDTSRNTKDKKLIKNKVDHILYLMKEFFNNEDSESSSKEENVETTEISTEETITEIDNQEISEQDSILIGMSDEDVECYDDVLLDIIKIDSPLYIKAREALIKLVDYVFQTDSDTEFESWLKENENELETSLSTRTQLEKYINMKKNFDEYVKQRKVAA